jgi:hypothetical protein
MLTTGNLLDAKVEALVNTVNTAGVMGTPIEAKREGEPESHNDQINNYQKAIGTPIIVLDAKNCGN